MDTTKIQYRSLGSDGDVDLEAVMEGYRLGYTYSVRDGDRLHLTDIHVVEQMPRRWPIAPRILDVLLGPRRPWLTRGLGVGTKLLTRLLDQGDADGVLETWGSVTGEDLTRSPWLLDWYARFGFAICDPDEECVVGAVKKIARRPPTTAGPTLG